VPPHSGPHRHHIPMLGATRREEAHCRPPRPPPPVRQQREGDVREGRRERESTSLQRRLDRRNSSSATTLNSSQVAAIEATRSGTSAVVDGSWPLDLVDGDAFEGWHGSATAPVPAPGGSSEVLQLGAARHGTALAEAPPPSPHPALRPLQANAGRRRHPPSPPCWISMVAKLGDANAVEVEVGEARGRGRG
jgi:hypothetical protein